MSSRELSSLTDQQLLKRYADSRCEDAFAVLVERHASLVLSVCRRHLPTEQDAEDAFQATFLILVRQAAAVRWRKSVGPWLYTVATKVTMNVRRATVRRRETDVGSQAEVPISRSSRSRLTSCESSSIELWPACHHAIAIRWFCSTCRANLVARSHSFLVSASARSRHAYSVDATS